MVDPDREEVVLVHLLGAPEVPESGPAPFEVSVPGICEALEIGGESMADRVALLSALTALEGEGLVAAEDRPVEGLNGERNVYALTRAGRDRAREVRERVRDERVVVRSADGSDREVPLRDVGQYLAEPALPRALSRVTDEGVVYRQEGIDDRFVDREAELERLETALEDALAEGRAALVAGEAGAGKTTLVTEALADAARDRGMDVLVGRAREGADRPYAPFRSALAEALDRADADPFEREGIAPEDEADYEAERTAVFETVAEFVASEADDDPFVLVVDDLHAAEEPTVALFDHLSRRVPAGVLLLGTYRPEDLLDDHPLSDLTGTWADAPDRPHVDLDPFGHEEVRGLIQWLLDRRDVPNRFVEAVTDHTGGNPLFVEESVRRMLAEGSVDPDHGIYPESVADVPVPDRVEEAVDLRLSVLDGDTLSILQIGALVGGSIPYDVLAGATDLDDAELRDRIDVLVDSRVWKRVGADRSGGSGRTDLRFVSGLVRETVVDRIPEDHRRDLHERVAEAIADLASEDPDRHAAVAHHYAAADRPAAAYEHYVRAAERAKRVYAHEIALDSYERALELARERLDRPESEVVGLLEDVGDVYYLLGEYDEADRYYRYVDERVTDPETGRRIAGIRADVRNARGEFERALELVEGAFETYGTDDTAETARLYAQKGSQHANLGEFERAEAAYDRARDLAERIDDARALATTDLDLGALALRRDDAGEDTVELLEDAVDAAERAGADRVRARALSNLAMAHRKRGELDRAEETARRRLAIQERIGDRVALCRARVYLAWVLQARGGFDEAESLHQRALETARRLDNRELTSRIHIDLGLLYVDRDDLAAASDHFERAMADAADLDDRTRRAVAALDLADTELDQGNVERAREAAESGYEEAAESGRDGRLAFAAAVLGKVRLAEGDLAAADGLFREGIAAAEDAGDPDQEAEHRAYLAEAHLAGDPDPESALEQAETAVERAEDRGIRTMARVRLGAALRASGQYDRAEDVLVETLSTVRDGDPDTGTVNRVLEARALLELARLERDRDDGSGVRGYATEGVELVERYGIGRYESALRELLSDAE